MNRIRDLFNELYHVHFSPTGAATKDFAIHTEVIADAAFNVSRLIGSYYDDEDLDLDELRLDDDLIRRIDQSIQNLTFLLDFKNRLDDLAKELVHAVDQQSKTNED